VHPRLVVCHFFTRRPVEKWIGSKAFDNERFKEDADLSKKEIST